MQSRWPTTRSVCIPATAAMPEPDVAGVLVRHRGRRALRAAKVGLLAASLGYCAAILCGMPPSAPFDVAWNLGGVTVEPALCASTADGPSVVVLQHGLWRSPWALWRLERALRAHGYEAHNLGYSSTTTTIEDAAESLAREVDIIRARWGADARIAFVGHSMGGLVAQEAMRRRPSLEPFACVYIAVPHRGAALCDLRKRWWIFPFLMGSGAAMQLSPGDAIHAQSIPHRDRSGVIVGHIEPGNRSLVGGPNDGTVTAAEATLEGAADRIVLPLGHTRIASSDETIRCVLAFLKNGRFSN